MDDVGRSLAAREAATGSSSLDLLAVMSRYFLAGRSAFSNGTTLFLSRLLLSGLLVVAAGNLSACDGSSATSRTDDPPGEDDPAALTGTITFSETAFTGSDEGTYNLNLEQGRAVQVFPNGYATRNAGGQYGLIQACGNGGVQVAFADARSVVTAAGTTCIDKTVDYRRATISPGGDYIAFRDYRRRPDGSFGSVGTIVVANRQGEEVAAFHEYEEPAWTPNGRLVIAGTGSERVPFGLYLTDDNLENPTRISGDQIQSMPTTPAVHPDGGRVVFGYNGGLWQMNLDGTDFDVVHQYEHSLAYPAWSPSGDRLAFVDTELSYGPRAIFILDEASGEVSQVEIPLQGTHHPYGPLSWVEE